MVIFYTLTTPLGIAIGIGINSSFNPNSTASLVAQGILDSISAGILMYDALVNVIVPHFKSPKFIKEPEWKQLLQFFCLYLGTAIMCLIGKWA